MNTTTQADPFSPDSNYHVPKSNSVYLTFEEGDTEFLPLDSPMVGWEYWTKDKKPVRLAEQPANPSSLPDIRPDIVREKDGSERTVFKVSHFWAFPVIDISDGRVKLLKITQNSIQKTMRAYIANPKWGRPVLKYTLTVNRSGSGLDTEYSVMANPTPEIPDAYLKAWEEAKVQGFSVQRWFEGGEVYEGPHTDVRIVQDPDAQLDANAA